MISRDLPGTLPGTIFGNFGLMFVVIIDNFLLFVTCFVPFAIHLNGNLEGNKHEKGKESIKENRKRKVKERVGGEERKGKGK